MLLFGAFSVPGLIAIIIVLVISVTLHEFAHNYVAYRMGDPTPAQMGRLTLNPLVHIEPVGWLMFLIMGFGTLGSAPISPHRMRNPRWGYLAAVAAGPLSNLLLAILTGLLVRLLGGAVELNKLPHLFNLIIIYMIWFNVILFLFNLLPLFPLDGWRITLCLLSGELAFRWERWQTYTTYILFGLILFSFVARPPIPSPLDLIIGEPASALMNLILGG